jgi:hypothetical protein
MSCTPELRFELVQILHLVLRVRRGTGRSSKLGRRHRANISHYTATTVSRSLKCEVPGLYPHKAQNFTLTSLFKAVRWGDSSILIFGDPKMPLASVGDRRRPVSASRPSARLRAGGHCGAFEISALLVDARHCHGDTKTARGQPVMFHDLFASLWLLPYIKTSCNAKVRFALPPFLLSSLPRSCNRNCIGRSLANSAERQSRVHRATPTGAEEDSSGRAATCTQYPTPGPFSRRRFGDRFVRPVETASRT